MRCDLPILYSNTEDRRLFCPLCPRPKHLKTFNLKIQLWTAPMPASSLRSIAMPDCR